MRLIDGTEERAEARQPIVCRAARQQAGASTRRSLGESLTEEDWGCQVVDSDRRPVDGETDVAGGVARLPQSSGSSPVLLTIEIEIDRSSQSVLAVYVNPDLGGLKRLIEGAIVGKSASAMAGAGAQAVMEHYHSPFRNAAHAALLHAWEAFAQVGKRSYGRAPERPASLRGRILD